MVILTFVAYRQSVYSHELLALNNQRSNNEAAIVQNIGYRLYSEYDNSKKVIFVGEVSLGKYIEEQISVKEGTIGYKLEKSIRSLLEKTEVLGYNEFVKKDVNSVISWSEYPFGKQQSMKLLFSHYGNDINTDETLDEYDERIDEIYETALKDGMKPYEIREYDDYILVFFGKKTDAEEMN